MWRAVPVEAEPPAGSVTPAIIKPAA